MAQCYAILRPGGVAVWVVKNFVRSKKVVPFCDQWRALGESCGFETVEVIRAWLVEDRGTQVDLWGNHHEHKVERKSFFRRLSEKKARAKAWWSGVSRDEQAAFLWQAHNELWDSYASAVEEADKMHPPIRPTRNRILSAAQMIAYVDAGEPDIDIDTAIDYEVVLVQRKAGLT